MRNRRKISASDRRAVPRYDVRKDGRLLFIDQPCCVECTIKNISEDGALLGLVVSVTLPRVVLLWERRIGAIHECEVKWRDGDTIGVHFTDIEGRRERRAVLEGPMTALQHVARHRTVLH